MGELSRGEFLRRLAVGTSLVAVPPSFLRQLERPAAIVAAPPPTHPLVSQWWVESGEDSITTVKITARHTIYEIHVIPPRGGVYVQMRPGREYDGRDLAISFRRHIATAADEFTDMPLRLAMDDGAMRSYIANADGLEIYAGAVTIEPARAA